MAEHSLLKVLLLCTPIASVILAQTPSQCGVSLVAGADWFDNGDFGPALTATLRFRPNTQEPASLAIDDTGTLFILEGGRVRKAVLGGDIRTIAGTGIDGFQGDGGDARVAQFYQPWSIGVDRRTGDVYIADTYNFRIRKVTPDGIVTAVAGYGVPRGDDPGDPLAATAALVDFPVAVAADRWGNLFIAERRRIRRVGSDGMLTTVREMYPNDSPMKPQLRGMAVDGAGNLYFADIGRQGLFKLNPEGVLASVQINGSPVSAYAPFTVDVDGNVYVGLEREVWKISASGESSPIAGTAPGATSGDGGHAFQAQIAPGALAVAATGEIYAWDLLSDTIRSINQQGIISTVIGADRYSGGPDASRVGVAANGVAVDRNGDVYVSDRTRHQIRVIEPGGSIRTVVGTGYPGFNGDGPAAETQLATPAGIVFDPAGNLYIADRGNHRIRRLSRDGMLTTIAGDGLPTFGGDDGPGVAAHLDSPGALAFDTNGNLYIADTDNHRVRKLAADGIISTVAGNGIVASNGDGGPAIDAAVGGPEGLATDAVGNLYVADRFFYRVRKISPDGVITTVAGTAKPGRTGDGGPASQAQLLIPYSLATGSDGSLYIGDIWAGNIRKVAPDGLISMFSCDGATSFYPYALATSGPDLYIAGQPSIFRAGPDGPAAPFSVANVWNAADRGHAAGPVAPGERIYVELSGVVPSVEPTFTTAGADGRLPTSSGNVQVLFDNVPVPIIGMDKRGVLALAPLWLADRQSARILVQVAGRQSHPRTVAVVPAFPVIFPDSVSALPAAIVTFRATGVGELAPPGADGASAPGILRRPRLPVSMRIGGNPAEVLSLFEVTGAPGVIQIDVRVPAATPTERWHENLLPVVLKVGEFVQQWWDHFLLIDNSPAGAGMHAASQRAEHSPAKARTTGELRTLASLD